MGEKVGGGDQLENQNGVDVGAPLKSPWKTSTTIATLAAADFDSWPALSEAKHRPKNKGSVDSNSVKSNQLPTQKKANANGAGGAPPAVPTPAKGEQQKFHGRGNARSARKPNNTHQPRAGPKHAANGAPPYPVRLPYPPPPPPLPFPAMVPGPIIPGPGYGYPFPPRTFPTVDTPLKSGSDVPAQGFAPSVNGGFPAPQRPGLGPHDPGSTGRMLNAKEQSGQKNPSANSQHPVIAENNFHMQHTMVPRPFMRPLFLLPNGLEKPSFSGPPPGTFYYISAGPHGPVRVPYPPMLYPSSHGVPILPPPMVALRTSIIKQVDYYFSDQNLQKDPYLISLMDEQGWVPISDVAEFKRLKSMSTDIAFILDSLLASETVEVKGNKIRRRDDWLKYIGNSAPSKSFALHLGAVRNDVVNVIANDSLTEDSSSNGSSVESRTLEKDSVRENNNSYSEQNTEVADSVKIPLLGNCGEKGHVISHPCGQNLDDSFSSTCMLGGEIELEQKRVKYIDPSTAERVGEENEIMLGEQAVERLIIVTRKSCIGSGLEEPKTISNEIASTINDGLYFYEQELNAKRSHGRPMKPLSGGKDENSKCFTDDVAAPDSKLRDTSIGRSSCEGSGSSDSGRRHDKSSLWQLPVHRQRLFPIRAHRGGQNSLISEKRPPTDAVGFFFDSAPPDSRGLEPSELSVSPHSHVSGSSPPVDSLPKSFPQFQHPSHKVLEENGFKQQLYKQYHKCCLSERNKLGIGRSEDMNKLYWFWSNFLTNMFIPTIYNEFQKLALEDAGAGYNYGVECLFRFYSDGLEKDFREDLYGDFEKLALHLYTNGNLYGLEEYWAFHHNRKGLDDAEPKKHPELDRLLREKFHSRDDFNGIKNATVNESGN